MTTGKVLVFPRTPSSDGLNIREYFAALAMQGFLSSVNWDETAANDLFFKNSAEVSVSMADALIAELNK